VKRILTIAGSDSGGGAGIQADLKTITMLGGFGMSAITALTAQNTVGVQGIVELDAEFVKRQIDSVLSDIGADAIKTGMLANSGIVTGVAEKIRQYRIEKVVVDPVMVAKSGDTLLKKEAQETVKRELLPLSYLVTPNLPEASVLSGHEVRGLDEMKRAAKAIHQLGARNVLVKGGHLSGDPIDLLFDGQGGDRRGKSLYDRCPSVLPGHWKRPWSHEPLCNGLPGNGAVSSYRGTEGGVFPAARGQGGDAHS